MSAIKRVMVLLIFLKLITLARVLLLNGRDITYKVGRN
jgi:uncharacterized membrane protein affecting hemolysin expression